MRRMQEHLTYANVVSSLALFGVLGGGTALAVDGSLPGQNTVGSEDIIDNDVKSADIADGRIFNADIASQTLTGSKIKDGTIWGTDMDIHPDLYRTESPVTLGTARQDGTHVASHQCIQGDALISGGPANLDATTDLVESFPSANHTWTARVQKNGVLDEWNVVVRCLSEN